MLNAQFTISFWFKFEYKSTLPNAKFTLLKISSTDPDTNYEQFIKLIAEKTNSESVITGVEGDATPGLLEYLNNKGNIFPYTDWIFAAVSVSNTDGFVYLRAAFDFIGTLSITNSRNWGFSNTNLRIMADSEAPVIFFPGQITKLDFLGGFFETSGTKLTNLYHGLPTVEYLLDFTDVEFTQYFKNRAGTMYGPAMRGAHNHTDVHDLFFNPTNGFSMRHYAQFIQLPKIEDTVENNFNSIVHYKFRGWGLNHWFQGSTRYYIWQRIPKGSTSWNYGLSLYKTNYADSLRGEVKTLYHRNCCNYNTSPKQHLAYTVEYGMSFHFFVSHIEQKATNMYACNGFIGGSYYATDPKLLVKADDYYIGGYNYDAKATFISQPFTDYGYNMDLELNLQLLIITKNGYKSNPYPDNPDTCADNTIEQYGTGEDGFKAICADGYSMIHEANLCILNPISDEFLDCAHDMDSVGGQCFRCLRYYGKQGLQGCFKCYDNCIQCIGGAKDECSYCGMGYGFTGTACNICLEDETWDVSTNFCQAKKLKFLEADYGYKTFGEIQLIFIPLDGPADLSIYVENMWERFWITDINMQYYLVRKYDKIPLHRKVSISFEFLMIDDRSYGYLWAAVDKEYVWSWSPNHEDSSIGADLSYWGYGYLDSIPYKITHTNFHSADTLEFGLIGFWNYDWNVIWFRELNVTFFGCYEACKSCWEDNSPVHCTECIDGFYLVGSECKTCSPVCKTCDGAAENCKSCPGEQFLKQSKCLQTCGLGWFPDASDYNNCKVCPNECIQCNTATSCNSCKNGYYINIDKCLPCDTNCVTCTATSTKCLSCTSSLYLRNFQCVASCGAGYYEIPGKICNQCPPGCTTCTSSECQSCDSGFKKKGNICANPCGVGWYDAGIDCQQCDAKCETCITSPSNCLSCKAGKAMIPPACPDCQSPCVTCSGTTTECTSCGGVTFLNGNICLAAENCPTGTYATNNICDNCDPSCETCVDTSKKCLTCHSPKVISGSECVAVCPEKFHQVGSFCCPVSCSSCTNSETCVSCLDGFYNKEGSCLDCSENCQTCVDFDKCLTCKLGNVLQGTTCTEACSLGFYSNNGICSSCHSSCSTCTGPLNTECISCTKAHILWMGLCQDCSDSQNPYFTSIDSNCWDKCGNGNRFTTLDLKGLGGYNSCDDGNLLSGDGCSADCRIEKNFRCEGGSTVNADKCYSKIKPNATIIQIFRDKYQIRFSHEVYFKDKNQSQLKPDNILNVSIADYSEINYNFTINVSSTPPYIYLNLSLTFLETVDSDLTVTFDRELILDSNNNSLKNSRLVAHVSYLIPPESTMEEPMNYTSAGFEIASLAVPPLTVSLTNYVTQSVIRSVLNFQLVKATSLINIKRSAKFENLQIGMVNISRNKIVSPFGYLQEKFTGVSLDTEGVIDPIPGEALQRRALELANDSPYSGVYETKEEIGRFKELGYSNSMIVNLSFSPFFIILAGMWYFLANLFCAGCINRRSGSIIQFIYFTGERFFFTSIIVSTLELSMFATLNILKPDLWSSPGILSLVLSVFALALIFAIPVMIFRLSRIDFLTLWQPDYYAKYGYLYCEFKLDRKVIFKY